MHSWAALDQKHYNEFKDIVEFMISEKGCHCLLHDKAAEKILTCLYDANEKTICQLIIQFLEHPEQAPSNHLS